MHKPIGLAAFDKIVIHSGNGSERYDNDGSKSSSGHTNCMARVGLQLQATTLLTCNQDEYTPFYDRPGSPLTIHVCGSSKFL